MTLSHTVSGMGKQTAEEAGGDPAFIPPLSIAYLPPAAIERSLEHYENMGSGLQGIPVQWPPCELAPAPGVTAAQVAAFTEIPDEILRPSSKRLLLELDAESVAADAAARAAAAARPRDSTLQFTSKHRVFLDPFAAGAAAAGGLVRGVRGGGSSIFVLLFWNIFLINQSRIVGSM